MNWDAIIGAAIATVLTALVAWFTKGPRRAADQLEITESEASTNVVQVLRGEFNRLADRVHKLEQRELRMMRHIYQLESLLRELGKEPPLFNVDADEPVT